jgi:hypothetical protein
MPTISSPISIRPSPRCRDESLGAYDPGDRAYQVNNVIITLLTASSLGLRGGKSYRKSLKSAYHAGKWGRVTSVAGRDGARC